MSHTSDTERRRSFRVNDHIGLTLMVIPEDQVDTLVTSFELWRAEHGLINQFLHQRTQLLPVITAIQNAQPDIAAYLRHLESKIDTLAGLIQAKDQGLPRSPTHSVNLSANGIRFYHDESIEEGSAVQIQLVLHPGLAIIPTIGKVISCHQDPIDDKNQYQMTVDFIMMDDDDRDLLSTHNITAQMKALQQDFETSP
jgi:hypothetical protein